MTEWYENRPISAGKEFLILAGLWVFGLVFGSLASVFLWTWMTGESALSLSLASTDPKFRSALLVIQSVSSVFTFLFPAVITSAIVSKNVRTHLGFSPVFHVRNIIIVLLIMGAAILLGGVLGDLNKAIPLPKVLRSYFDAAEKQYNDAIRAILFFRNTADYFIALFVIAVIPAFVEEVMFRGAMQQVFVRWFNYPLLAIFVTSFIFSAIHFSWYGFIPRIALGMVLGYIFFYTRNLWYSILAHFFNNALTVTLLYFQYVKEKKIDLESQDSMPWWSGLLSLLFLIVLMIPLHRFFVKQKREEEEKELREQKDFLKWQ